MCLHKFCLLILATVLMSGVEFSQSGSDFQGSERVQVEKTFSEYNQALVEKKYDELKNYLQVPFMVVDSAQRIITDIDAVVAGLRRNRESLDEKGYAKSIPAKAHISVLAPDRVLLNRIIRHYRTDGSLIEARSNFYLMTKTSGVWKISGVIQQELGYSGKVY